MGQPQLRGALISSSAEVALRASKRRYLRCRAPAPASPRADATGSKNSKTGLDFATLEDDTPRPSNATVALDFERKSTMRDAKYVFMARQPTERIAPRGDAHALFRGGGMG
jgi:hypothetical protein